MYGNSGVCRIVDIRPEKFGEEKRVYYILKPDDNENSTIYCPVDCNKVNIRRLLSIQEVRDLIKIMPDTQMEWIENDQQRKETFTEILRQGDRRELVKLIKTLYFHREAMAQAGRKFRASDERIMKEAEKVLHGELAHVLQISQDQVVPFIMGELENAEESRKPL